jgi:hypothetical protein
LDEGFENVSDGTNPDGWVANNYKLPAHYAELAVDNTISHDGNKSIFVSISKKHPLKTRMYNWFKRVDGLEIENVYELSGWIKIENIRSSPFIEIQFWNKYSKVGVVSTLHDNFFTGTTNWVQIKKLLSVPKGTTKIMLRAALQSSNNNGGRVWFDDIQIKRLE